MNKNTLTFILLIGLITGLSLYSLSFSYTHQDTLVQSSSQNKSITVTEPLPQVVRSASLNKVFTFAGEDLPYDNFDVMERLDRELIVNSYRHSSTLLNLKLSKRYFPLFERTLREHGIPEDFKYLAVAESNLTNATSPSGAKGLWQFMKATGKAYGLEVSTDVDERYHPEKATEAACQLLKDYKNRFGSWTLAAAAYNVGETRLSKEINRQQESTYFDLNLNKETDRYIFRIVAFKEIMQNPTSFGFYINDRSDVYRELNNYRLIEVNQSIASLGEFAHQHGTTYRMLKIYNPWLITGKLSNKSGKKYLIKIPN